MVLGVDCRSFAHQALKIIPAIHPKQCVCVRSKSRKSRDLDALGSREVMVVIKVGIVVTVGVVVSE